MIRQDIDEYTAIRGDTAGVIISEQYYEGLVDINKLKLFEVLWPDSEIEKLYENEVELLSETR